MQFFKLISNFIQRLNCGRKGRGGLVRRMGCRQSDGGRYVLVGILEGLRLILTERFPWPILYARPLDDDSPQEVRETSG